LTYSEVDVRIKIETCESLLPVDVASVFYVTVLQVENRAGDISDTPGH
jgi:hypothetical protein